MDGKSVLVELKKDCQLKHIPVVIFTTSSALEDKEEAEILGAASFITKPYEFDKLCKSIQSVVELSCLEEDQKGGSDIFILLPKIWTTHP